MNAAIGHVKPFENVFLQLRSLETRSSTGSLLSCPRSRVPEDVRPPAHALAQRAQGVQQAEAGGEVLDEVWESREKGRGGLIKVFLKAVHILNANTPIALGIDLDI